MFSKKVSDYITRHSLLDADKRHLVAVSGGADSIALVLVLLELGYKIEVAHCNFKLRGNESDRDEEFVKTFSLNHKIPFHVIHFDTVQYAELHKISIELAARKLRYAYFRQLCNDIGGSDICVAHHRDDNVETLLMNLVRGTGIRGLAGIQPDNGGIKRPLLCVSRMEIENYLAEKKQTFVTDSTNLIDEATRNKFRLNVIPILERINPKAPDNINRTATYISEAIKIFDKAIKEGKDRVVKPIVNDNIIIDITSLLKEPSPEYLLYEIVLAYGFSTFQIENIYSNIQGQTGKVFSSKDFELLIDRNSIIIERKKALMAPKIIYELGTYIFPGIGKICLLDQTIDRDFKIIRKNNFAFLDSEKVKFPLSLRLLQPGDRFIPFGMKGSKLVSDYMTDIKKTLFQKRKQLVITEATGNIIWLVGERPDNRYYISPHTKKALIISLTNCESNT